jgi:Tfp pilus assembly protein FimT
MRHSYSRKNRHLQVPAFTVVEIVFVSLLMLILASVGFRSMFAFSEQRKVRTAAVELASYLRVARSVALSENKTCGIALTNTNGGVFGTDTTLSDNACVGGKIPSSINLRSISGSRNLQANVLSGSNSFPLKFTPEGTLTNDATVVISSSDAVEGSWCVDVQAPLATVRMGWRAAGSNDCNYTTEQ